MKQYTFKDGFKCVASTKEEAIAKHKVMAGKIKINMSKLNKLINKLGLKDTISIYDDSDGYIDVQVHYPYSFKQARLDEIHTYCEGEKDCSDYLTENKDKLLKFRNMLDDLKKLGNELSMNFNY